MLSSVNTKILFLSFYFFCQLPPIALLLIMAKFLSRSSVVCLQFLTFHSPVCPFHSALCYSHSIETSLVKKICDVKAYGPFSNPAYLICQQHLTQTLLLGALCHLVSRILPSLLIFLCHLTGHFFLYLFACSSPSLRLFFCLHFFGDLIQSRAF